MWRRTSSRSLTTSWPATRAAPPVGLASVQSMLIVVVLPAPLGPRKPNTSPAETSKLTPATASTSSKDLRSSLTSIGVSNFQVPHLERLAAECDVVPAVNQIEVHPYFLNTEVRSYGERHGIA